MFFIEASTPKQEKLNSTVCNGGNTLSKSFLDTFSPIKKKTLRKTPHKPLQILRQSKPFSYCKYTT